MALGEETDERLANQIVLTGYPEANGVGDRMADGGVLLHRVCFGLGSDVSLSFSAGFL